MRPEQKSIKVNFIMNAFLTMSSFIFPLITFPYVSRILLPEGIGKIALAVSVVSYFGIFASLGIPMHGVRACAQVRDDKIALSKVVHELFIISVVVMAVCYAAFFVALFSVQKMAEEKTLFLIASCAIFLQVISVEWLYKALEEYSYITYRSLIFKVIAIILMFALVHQKSDYIVYEAINVFAACGSAVVNLYNIRKLIVFKPFMEYDLIKHIKPILVLFATTCAIMIYVSLNTVILGFMKTSADVGLYDSAMKIKTFLTMFVTSLGTVILPRASYYVQQGNFSEFSRICAKAWHFVCLIALPLVVYFVLFASNAIYLLSGPAFEGAIVPMQIVMPTVLFIGLTCLMGIQIFIPLGGEKYVLYASIVGAIVDLVLCVVLIPTYGVAGAAIANSIAELVVLITQIVLLMRYKDKFDIVATIKKVEFWKLCVGLLASTLCVMSLRNLQMHHFYILLISGTIFMSVYGLCLLILKEGLFCEIATQVYGKAKSMFAKKLSV